MFGVLFAWLRFYHQRIFEKIALPAFISGIILVYFFMHLHSLDSTGYYAKTFYFSLVGLSAAMLLPFASLRQKCTTRFGRMMTFISVISYSMYLLNLAPVASVIDKNFRPEGALAGLTWYFIYWITVIGASTLLYKYFEKPVMDLRESNIRLTRKA
jgi:peptidoglycan/LPS O-acetylase OafA/YrhL